jgi:hypothetical protein
MATLPERVPLWGHHPAHHSTLNVVHGWYAARSDAPVTLNVGTCNAKEHAL